jgi:hypothetical protein
MPRLFLFLLAILPPLWSATAEAADVELAQQIAPNGTYVGGTSQIAPNGSYVGGTPQIAPNGSYVGVGRR